MGRVCLLFGVVLLWGCSGAARTEPFPYGEPDGGPLGDLPVVDTVTRQDALADASRCTRQSDCDDGFACTEDACVSDGSGGGVCEHVTDDRACASGERCFVGRGCASGRSCARNEDCDDRVACTRDLCVMASSGPTCQSVRDDSRCTGTQVCSVTMGCLEPGTCGADADCDDRRYCNGPERCVVGGVCEHEGDDSQCAAGQVCNAAGCGAPGTRACNVSSDCDDRVACTRDTCLVERVCQHRPQDSLCPAGQVCNAATGCGVMTAPTTCRTAGDCDDTFECTEDQCQSDGRCAHIPQNARCPAGRRCAAGMGCVAERACSTDADCDDHLTCNGRERCSELACGSGTPLNCDDGDPCTRDSCAEGDASVGVCQHVPEASCMGMTPQSGIYSLATSARYTCRDVIIGGVALEYNVTSFTFAFVGGRVIVTGALAEMEGAAPVSGVFDVTGRRPGTCDEVYRLQGRFSDTTHFTGTFTVSFVGAGCALTDCRDQTYAVAGTAMARP